MVTVSQNITEQVIKEYVKNQGNSKYKVAHKKDDTKLVY